MRLITFGRVALENCSFSRPKPLLLLAYLAVEGSQERSTLANLFWAEGKDKQKLVKLSVILNQFKKEGAAEVVPNKAGINPLPTLVSCDAIDFLEALETKDLKGALKLYQDSFLQSLGRNWEKLDLSPELFDWITLKREYFADKAREAMLMLAEQALVGNEIAEVRLWAEKAQGLNDASEAGPELLARLQKLLSAASGNNAATAGQAQQYLENLSDMALQVFLALSLQDLPNLAIVRTALKLSPSDIARAQEELILAGFIDNDTNVKAAGLAKNWFDKYPKEHFSLLISLARATPPENSFAIYQQVYKQTQGFGGIGDMPKARKAYALKARNLIEESSFTKAAELLASIRKVAEVLDIEPESEIRFLEAYALERIGNYKDGLKLLEGLNESLYTPDIVALKATLLWRRGRLTEAKEFAEHALQSGLEWSWAKATAMNTFGYLAHAEEDFSGAIPYFKKAASFYQLTSDKSRWVGALNNYATTLDKLANESEEQNQDENLIFQLKEDTEHAYQEALSALDQITDNPPMRARILLNLGLLWVRRENWSKAEAYYLKASEVAEQIEVNEIAATIQLNLGYMYSEQKQVTKAKECLNKAIDMAQQMGEFCLQGIAMANLAYMNNDLNSMEVALELLEQSDSKEETTIYQQSYERMLKRSLEKVLLANNVKEAQSLLKKLEALYQEQERLADLAKVRDTMLTINNLANLKEHYATIMAILETCFQNTVEN